MPWPNFFVIGAPKAGTTALHATLIQHPDIYMSPVKEPHFFICEGQKPPLFPGPGGGYLHHEAVWQAEQYSALFDGVTTQRAIGEASAGYLFAPQAARNIYNRLPHSKIVAILRQPAERAYSHYCYRIQNRGESAPTFEIALQEEAQGLRKGWSAGVLHRKNGFYYAQLSRYFALFPREHIQVYLYEDWKRSPHEMLRDLFAFLEVNPDFAPQIRTANVTLMAKNRFLDRAAKGISRRLPLAAARLDAVNRRWNRVPAPPLDPETRRRLTLEYRDDILKLQDLIGRDLSHWLATS